MVLLLSIFVINSGEAFLDNLRLSTQLNLKDGVTSTTLLILHSCENFLSLETVEQEDIGFIYGCCLVFTQIFHIDTFEVILLDLVKTARSSMGMCGLS